jgi:hypothetical protein
MPEIVFHYNFIRIHQTIRCTPAMAAGVRISSGRCPIWLP